MTTFSIRMLTSLGLSFMLETMLFAASVWAAETGDEAATLRVNVATPDWGTQISASTVFSEKYAPANLADGAVDGAHCWFGQDGAALPQHVTFAFSEPQTLTDLKLVQAEWVEQQYRCKDFAIETSLDGAAWASLKTGVLAVEAGSPCSLSFEPVDAQWLRITLTSSYDSFRTCGLAEVEIYARKPKDARPPYAGASREMRWDLFGRHFVMQLDLDPPAALWRPEKDNTADEQLWTSGAYRLEWHTHDRGASARVIEYALTRSGNEPFVVKQNRVEMKTSYAGVYKIFTPGTMSQQNYRIDLPFRMDGACRAEDQSPVIWLQETSGGNTIAVGMLDQIRVTHFEGSTYDTSNGGEAPGIANSYVRAGFVRVPQDIHPVQVFKDGIYINADTEVSWFDALQDYAGAVDTWRGFAPKPCGKNALRPMWHSWYAHADKIDQAQLLDDATRAAALGVQTLEIDAGWNVPPGVGYSFAVEGDYDFDTGRFPDAKGMIDRMHGLGLAIVMHVGPLLMGKQAKAFPEMNDAILRVKGEPTAYLDPRLAKSRDYLVNAWEKLLSHYGVDGLWYDFLELPEEADPPAEGAPTISTDLHEAYTLLMQQLYEKALAVNPDAVIVLRRGSANLNAKTYATHVWPMDTPQDYNMNRRDIVYLKTFGEGVLTHACCTSWPISESAENVARQMASITMAGVPAFSVKLAESPPLHNDIIRAWLKFYAANKEDLVMGRMTPLLPTPPSAAVRIEGKDSVFFGFFEAIPGLIHASHPVDRVVLVNAFSNRLVTRIEGIAGDYTADVFDETWARFASGPAKNDGKGICLDFSAPGNCFSVVLRRNTP